MRLRHSDEPKALTKSKELEVYAFLQKAGVPFEFQCQFRFKGCGLNSETQWAMVDFVLPKPWGYILLEVDEDQHRFYLSSCDPRRDFDIAASVALGSSDKLVLLRYNPDAFKVDGRTVHLAKTTRQVRLFEVLADWEADPFPNQNFVRTFLFYDSESEASLPQVAVEWDRLAREVSHLISHRSPGESGNHGEPCC